MFKKLISIMLGFIVIIQSFGFNISAQRPIPNSLDKPLSLVVRESDSGTLSLRWSNPISIVDIANNISDYNSSVSLYYVIDWKKNNGDWNIGLTYNDINYNEDIHDFFYGNVGNVISDSENTSEIFLVTWHLEANNMSFNFKLTDNTYYFRMRYVLEYNNGDEYLTITSPYTDVFAIGKDANTTKINKLDAPQNLKVEVKQNPSNGKPYFTLNWTIPSSVIDANKYLPVYHLIDFKVGNGKWLSESSGIDWLPVAPSMLLTSTDTFDPIEKNLVDKIVIEENTYYFRILFEGNPTIGGENIYSPYSNVVSTKMKAYSEAASWAIPELDKAVEYGLITDSIKNKMSSPITREEFAELAVRLYEVYSEKSASPFSQNPFKDCKNTEVLKAYNLGIVAGTSQDTFHPKNLTNREQIAAMLNRAATSISPNDDFSTVSAPSFNDQKDISSWALNNVKFMAKKGFIVGSNGYFRPKGTTTCQEAVLIAVRIYEHYKK